MRKTPCSEHMLIGYKEPQRFGDQKQIDDLDPEGLKKGDAFFDAIKKRLRGEP
jgi:hypothetical protein